MPRDPRTQFLTTWLRRLRREFPTEKPVRIRRADRIAEHGITEELETYYRITIRREDWRLMLDTLLHEYAHVMVWDKEKTHHNHEWGKAYARVYRWYANHPTVRGPDDTE